MQNDFSGVNLFVSLVTEYVTFLLMISNMHCFFLA